MAKLIKFRHSSRGYIATMKSGGVRGDLLRRGRQVQAVAQARTDNVIIADTTTGRTRAGATVIGVPLRQERRQRILGGAMDAARR